MKKKYIKPTIIDLSIEGMTGFGYGVLSSNCDTGPGFSSGSCTEGGVPNSSCSEGSYPTNECSNGSFPSDNGTYCCDGINATGRSCEVGPTVSGFNPFCNTGGTGVFWDVDCPNGPSANYCDIGNSNVGGFS